MLTPRDYPPFTFQFQLITTVHAPLWLLCLFPPASTTTDRLPMPITKQPQQKTKSRADDLAEARAADTESSADRAAREAVVRRLDNERQYLKSQLQSEITCKDELREALTRATGQLGEMKVQRCRAGRRTNTTSWYKNASPPNASCGRGVREHILLAINRS